MSGKCEKSGCGDIYALVRNEESFRPRLLCDRHFVAMRAHVHRLHEAHFVEQAALEAAIQSGDVTLATSHAVKTMVAHRAVIDAATAWLEAPDGA